MNWVRIGDTFWNLGAIARITCDEQAVGSAWADWVVGVVTLASGKEFGVSESDFHELEMAIEKMDDDDLAL